MTNFKERVKLLNSLISSNIEYINNGGCGIFAKEAYQVLTRKGKRVKIFIQSSEAEHQYKNLANRNRINRSVPGHVVLECEGILFDGLAIHKPVKNI